jgi:hypothetical protein
VTGDETPPAAADGAGSAARAEAARQLVELAATLAAVPLIIWLQRKMGDPDAFRTLRMRLARSAERLCATGAKRLWEAAERARLAYEEERA